MKRISRALTLAFLLGLLTACQPKGPILTRADDGRTATINMHGSVVVELAANPSTGFTWEVAAVDASVLKQAGEAEYQSGSPNPAPGSGGTQTLRFAPVAPGSTTLKLTYHRPFEKDTPPADTFTIQVTVQP